MLEISVVPVVLNVEVTPPFIVWKHHLPVRKNLARDHFPLKPAKADLMLQTAEWLKWSFLNFGKTLAEIRLTRFGI